ncbi:hypothetical protein [Flavonifractor plautii]|uniref:Uncharacterized protein n=1 Tax=Flavonifractor plautii TaxID=292800 RepID=A0A6I2R6J7_FLAPL|nr:hypothetical protein [Flavonifractor plautii]MSB20580.1 hypothetical protein [Flavonifractor plautii]MSB84435.1 hypothetical protein [Flavonifractor plautii]
MNHMPRFPFSACSPGPAQEVGSIQDIPRRKRIPRRWLTALAVILVCGSLSSCRQTEAVPSAEEVPVFTLTTPGEETLPFSNLLGVQGTVTHTVDTEGSHWYTYQAQLPDGPTFALADGSGAFYHVDLDGDGQLELVEYDADIGALGVWRRWPDGSIREQELSQAAANRFDLKGDPRALIHLTFHPEDTTVTISSAEKEETVPLSLLLEYAHSGAIVLTTPDERNPEGTPLSTVLPFGTYSVFCEKLSLDGTGKEDDSLIVTSFDDDSPQGPLTVAEVSLGTGETFTWRCDDTGYPNILPAHLTSPERQSIVLLLQERFSNHGAASYFVLDLESGSLVEKARLGTGDAASGDLAPDSEVQSSVFWDSRPDGLDILRISTQYPGKHTRYGSLFWNGAEIAWEADTRFMDTHFLTLADGRELTVQLSGPVSQVKENAGYDLCYDLVEIWNGDTLLQTVTPTFPLPNPHVFDEDTMWKVTIPEDNYPRGFSADSDFHHVDIRDINFDGTEDLGLPCDTTLADMHAWYLWNPISEQFEYSFALPGEITVDEENQTIRTNLYDDTLSVYDFNARGQLCWIGPYD